MAKKLGKKSWKKLLRHQQKAGWCGPAVIQMVLASSGRRLTQAKIAKDVFLPWWGTTQDAIYAYLSKFFTELNFKKDSTLSDLTYHLERGHIIIVNWWDDLDPEDADGHYTLLLDYAPEKRKVTLGDPSSGRGIWKMDSKEFNNHWYDSLDERGKKWVAGWMLWVNPKAKRS